MKRIATMMLVAAISSHAFAQSDSPRVLKAENAMLRKQIASLKQNLAAAKKEIEDLKAKLKESTEKPPATNGEKPETPAGEFHVTLHENYDGWQTNPGLLKLEAFLREVLKNQYPDQAPSVWLARQNRLAGYEVTWLMRIEGVRDISGIAASDGYGQCQKALGGLKKRIKSAKERIAQAQESGRLRRVASAKRELQNASASLEEKQAKLALWARLNRAGGGAIIELHLPEPQSRRKPRWESKLIAYMALTGNEAIKAAKFDRMTGVVVSGKILRMWANSQQNSFHLTVEATLTQEEKEEEEEIEGGN